MTSGDIQRVQVGDIEIAYETFGDVGDPPVLLVMGLATQMIGWPDQFCRGLAERGLFVVRFDNRDIGLSTHLHDAGAPDLGAVLGGDATSVPYALTELADDTVGLLDALGLDSAHLVGASMGGMIAQLVAIREPKRVRSLTSIMSTTGDPAVGAPAEAATGVLFAPPATDREGAIQRAVDTYRVIGSPGFEFDETGLRERAGISFDRAYDPAGVARQLAAILTTPDRTADLAAVSVPTLVVHGSHDTLIDVSGGRATAAAIPGCDLLVVGAWATTCPARCGRRSSTGSAAWSTAPSASAEPASAGEHPALDREGGAGDVPAGVADQEHQRGGELLGIARAAHQHPAHLRP